MLVGVVAALASSVVLVARDDADARSAPRTGSDVAPSTTRVPTPDEHGDFVSVARSTFPELDNDEAECLAQGALPRLSTEIIVTLLMDRDAPLKTSPEQRDVLSSTIDDCVPRATAIEIIARHVSQLASRSVPALTPTDDFSFSDYQCLDREIGDVDVGATFFNLYTAPLEFQEQLARVALECSDDETQRGWLGRWVDSTGVVLPSPWTGPGRSEQWVLMEPTPARDCLQTVLGDVGDDQVPQLVEQVLLSAAPASLEGRLDDLVSWFSTCAQPVPRGSGA